MQLKNAAALTVFGAVVAFSISAPALAQIAFEDRTDEIKHQYLGGWSHFVGGGVAVFDCNHDGFPEVFLAGGEAPSLLLANNTGSMGGELSFAPRSDFAFDLEGATGAYPINIDNDAFIDLVVLRVGDNKLLRGIGECLFEEASNLLPDVPARWTTAFSATWETNQSRPTLAFGNYVDQSAEDGPFGACDKNVLMRPKGNVYGEAIELEPGYCPLSILFSDWNRSGKQDLRISNDRHYYLFDGQEQLFSLEADGVRSYAAEDGWQNHKIWGMGIASRDLNFDGRPEIYLTSMGDQKLHQLADDAKGPTYEDAKFERGISAHQPFVGDDGRPSTGWHAQFGDVQNDGMDDIFVAKGNVDQMMSAAMKDPNNLLVQKADGHFEEVAHLAGLTDFERSRGAALVDLNMDGALDLVVNNRRANAKIYQNVTKGLGNWVSLKVKQDTSNVDAIGAWIELDIDGKIYARELTIGGGHAGGQIVPEHFGVNAAEVAKVRIIWPDGAISDWQEIIANTHYVAQRDGDQIRLNNVVASEVASSN